MTKITEFNNKSTDIPVKELVEYPDHLQMVLYEEAALYFQERLLRFYNVVEGSRIHFGNDVGKVCHTYMSVVGEKGLQRYKVLVPWTVDRVPPASSESTSLFILDLLPGD